MNKSKQTQLQNNKSGQTPVKKKTERINHWESQIKKSGTAPCGYKKCNFVGTKVTDLENHFKKCKGVPESDAFHCSTCKFSFENEEILKRHKSKCGKSKNDGSKHFSSVKKIQNQNDDPIVQPVPEVPQGEYKRRRPYTKEHKSSWMSALKMCNYVKCMYQNCYFIAMSLEDMIAHYGYCNGDGNFARFPCPHCGGRVTSEAVLLKHLERSHSSAGVPAQKEKDKDNSFSLESSTGKSEEENTVKDYRVTKSPKAVKKNKKDQKENPELHANGCAVESNSTLAESQDGKPEGASSPKGMLERLLLGGKSSLDSSRQGINISAVKMEETLTKEKEMEDISQAKKHGEKSKNETQLVIPSVSGSNELVKCGKCDFAGTRKCFVGHNLKKHVGLGWIEGETPVDMEDERELIRLVKMAFKLTKKGVCENCHDVKKSFMGFVTHIQICGKSAEEKHALKVPCPHCSGKYLKYSLPVHIKVAHTDPQGEELEEDQSPAVKRNSALKAVSKFQETLTENEEEPSRKTYFLYEKDTGTLPRLCSKLNNLWYRLKREGKKIPCRHDNCTTVSEDVREAKIHHYWCPFLPGKVYMCEACDFYSLDETTIQTHVTVHRRLCKPKKVDEEAQIQLGGEEQEEEEEEEPEMDEGNDLIDLGILKKKRKTVFVASEMDDEIKHRQNFSRRENLETVRGFLFYNNCLSVTLEDEISEVETSESWRQLHSTQQDWCPVPPEVAAHHFPELSESISVSFSSKKETKWRKMKRFEGDIIDGVPTMFLGGSIRSMSWCKTTFERMIDKTTKQYLAVSTARGFDHFKDVFERSSLSNSTLVQIWDCGRLENASAKDVPKLSLAIVHEGGEVWDLSWFPEDTSAYCLEGMLPRLGLLGTACQDGIVRIWSICDPSELHNNTTGLPIYETEPMVKLIFEENFEESCYKLAIGRGGIVAGGFSNGTLALWNLMNIYSPFCKTVGRCQILRPHCVIQAHRALITAIAFCPGKSRYLSTGGLDQFIKVWDLESPCVPVEQLCKEVCLDVIWARNWPLLIYNFDDALPNINKGCLKFVRNALWEKHQSCFSIEDTCLGLTFSDWLNVLCACSNTGDIKFRLMKNFVADQKKTQSTLSSLNLQKLSDGEVKVKANKAVGLTYEEVISEFGLVFKDNLGMDQIRGLKSELEPEETPVRAVNKVAFNPNFMSFTHLAAGYNCGLVRIPCLKELQSDKGLKSFVDKIHRK